MIEYKEYQINSDFDGVRLDRFLIKHLYFTNGVLNKFLRKKFILINKNKAIASQKLLCGNIVYVEKHILNNLDSEKKKSKSTIDYSGFIKKITIFEDDDIIVINKPSGIASQGGVNIAAGIDYMTSSLCDTYLVHRLDKETSGVMVIAKNYPTSRKLSEMFVNGLIKKTYYALLCNVPKGKLGVIDAALVYDGKNVCVDKACGKMAITEYNVISEYENTGLAMLSPKTGRKHQIRVHMSYIGCPIVGDFKYGYTGNDKNFFLYAHSIYLPGFGFFKATPPNHMIKYLEKFI